MDKRVAARRGRKVIHLEVVEHLLAGRRLTRFGSVGAETQDELLQFLGLLLVDFALVLFLPRGELGVFIPEIVVANVHLNLAVVDIHDMRADFIQKVAVVRDHDDRVRKVYQELFQPVDGVDIKVVGRLVQEEDIGFGKQRLRQKDFHLAGAVQFRHGLVMRFRRKPETVEEDLHVRLGVPAVALGKLAFELRKL